MERGKGRGREGREGGKGREMLGEMEGEREGGREREGVGR